MKDIFNGVEFSPNVIQWLSWESGECSEILRPSFEQKTTPLFTHSLPDMPN
jgi:hypothetical protein